MEKYTGEWKNDVRHGQGTFTFSDGEEQKQQWNNGEIILED